MNREKECPHYVMDDFGVCNWRIDYENENRENNCHLNTPEEAVESI